MIVGFCGETEDDHAASLDLMRAVGFDQAFLFAYSLRDKTHAARHYQVRCAALCWLRRRSSPPAQASEGVLTVLRRARPAGRRARGSEAAAAG